jgi:hypothetical protein
MAESLTASLITYVTIWLGVRILDHGRLLAIVPFGHDLRKIWCELLMSIDPLVLGLAFPGLVVLVLKHETSFHGLQSLIVFVKI